MAKPSYIHGCSAYYIYGQKLLHLWLVDKLHYFVIKSYYIYGQFFLDLWLVLHLWFLLHLWMFSWRICYCRFVSFQSKEKPPTLWKCLL